MGSGKNDHVRRELLQLVEDRGRQLIKGKETDLVLLDFSKAFDKVSHLTLVLLSLDTGYTLPLQTV